MNRHDIGIEELFALGALITIVGAVIYAVIFPPPLHKKIDVVEVIGDGVQFVEKNASKGAMSGVEEYLGEKKDHVSAKAKSVTSGVVGKFKNWAPSVRAADKSTAVTGQ